MVDPVRDEFNISYIGPDALDLREEIPSVSPAVAAARAHDIAVVIGVSRYDQLPRVPYADLDAEAMASRFHSLGFSTAAVKLMIDSDATYTDMVRVIEGWLPRVVRPDSRVYVYFSGHGSPSMDDGSSYLVPKDGDAAYVKTTAYSLRRLSASLAALPARSVYVMLDSCFSGLGARSVIASGLRPLVVTKKDPLPANVSLLAAATGEQAAGTSVSAQHGLFTKYLLEALAGHADVDRNSRLSLSELHRYVLENVRKEAQKSNREQTPTLDTMDPEKEF